MFVLHSFCLQALCLAEESKPACIANDVAPDTATEMQHALLQIGQITRHAILRHTDRPQHEDDWRVSYAASKGIGATAPTTEAGYQEVAATCCNRDMAEFAYRIVDKLGLVVCDQGGLAGLVIWYNCGHTSSLDALEKNLLASQPPVQCSFVAPVGLCEPKDPSCGGVIDYNAFKECVPTNASAKTGRKLPTTEAPTTVEMSTTLEKKTTTQTPTTTEMATTTTTTTTQTPTTTEIATTTTTTFSCPGYCPDGKSQTGSCKDNYMDACAYPGCIGGMLITRTEREAETIPGALTVHDCYSACANKAGCTLFKFTLGGATYGPRCTIISNVVWNGINTRNRWGKFQTKYTQFISCPMNP